MLPRYHIILGLIFSLLFWILFPSTNPIFIALIFLASIFIDFDHYYIALIRNKHFSLRKAFDYHKITGRKEMLEHKKGIRNKGDFHILHTVELIVLVGFLGFVWKGFFYIFIGMIFHSLLDIIFMVHQGILYKREFVLGNWISKKLYVKFNRKV